MAEVKLVNIDKFYSKDHQVVFNFNLDIKDHEFIVLVGPSGCGKSTTLRMIAGLEDISSGELYIDGVLSNDIQPKDRQISMIFQSYALFPSMNVRKNIGYGLSIQKIPYYVQKTVTKKIKKEDGSVEVVKEVVDVKKYRKLTKEEINERVNEIAKIVELEQYLDRKPRELSGGQRQRVALGRAIARKAKVYLMDEPLSNLDAKLRVNMRKEIIEIHKKLGATTVYVTHDQLEAMTMATRIVVMKDGYVQQIGTPNEIYDHPVNKFVAGFIGSPTMNFIPSDYETSELDLPKGLDVKGNITVGVRPEDVNISRDNGKYKGIIDLVEIMGNDAIVNFTYNGIKLTAFTNDRSLQIGDEISFDFNLNKVHIFDSNDIAVC